ncbi:MAG: GNAT family N-acetyltransferase [Treponema sp.]|jgi:GNAT superfamily N-acetyltransferase|nr:GNAT family N-acetyltransferase [Treponema sp.]
MKSETTDDLQIRFAVVEDVPLILDFIRKLAEYEHMLDKVVATEEVLREWLFEKGKAEALIGEINGEPVAFALFFHNFSTFLGRGGIYIEDLYVHEESRGKGIGRKMLEFLARLALERGCGRLEWWCLDWNKSSIAFYLSLGAVAMSDWTVYRVTGDALKNLANESQV